MWIDKVVKKMGITIRLRQELGDLTSPPEEIYRPLYPRDDPRYMRRSVFKRKIDYLKRLEDSIEETLGHHWGIFKRDFDAAVKRAETENYDVTVKSNHPLYQTWLSMKDRCTNPKCVSYKNYGGRGIKVCDRWTDDFWTFAADMGVRPAGRSIDRIDNDGDYTPDNCRWATKEQQMKNRGRANRP